MKRRVIVDTGILVALLNKKDSYHLWSVSQLKTIQPPLLTCEAVISEVSFLTARNKQGMSAIFNYLKLGVIETPFCFSTEYEAIEKLMGKFGDVPMSFADACLVRMAEQHGNSCVFTLDSDFLVYRKNGNEAISLIYPNNVA